MPAHRDLNMWVPKRIKLHWNTTMSIKVIILMTTIRQYRSMSVKLQKVKIEQSQFLQIAIQKDAATNIYLSRNQRLYKSAILPHQEATGRQKTKTQKPAMVPSDHVFTNSNSLMNFQVQTVALTQTVIPTSYSNACSNPKSENKIRNHISSIRSLDFCLTCISLFYRSLYY